MLHIPFRYLFQFDETYLRTIPPTKSTARQSSETLYLAGFFSIFEAKTQNAGYAFKTGAIGRSATPPALSLPHLVAKPAKTGTRSQEDTPWG
jgi:hypothetical protein